MLISFEGIDGSGKSTQIELLKEFLESNRLKVSTYREPGGTHLGEQIRKVLLDPENHLSDEAETLLFSAARAQLVAEKIIPDLSSGKIVLLDRFFDSTLAYQGYGRGLGSKRLLNHINEFATRAQKPVLTVYIDVEIHESEKRRAQQQRDRMENAGLAFFERVKAGYLDLIAQEPARWLHIDGHESIETIHRTIVEKVNSLLNVKPM